MTHLVYATTELHGCLNIFRVSEPLEWHAAINLHDKLIRELRCDRRCKRVGATTAARLPVRFFSVRAADDPNWPVHEPRSTVRINGHTFKAGK